MDTTLSFILDEVRQRRFEELAEIAFDWELYHPMPGLWRVSEWEIGYDESWLMFYGSDYFIERDEVH